MDEIVYPPEALAALAAAGKTTTKIREQNAARQFRALEHLVERERPSSLLDLGCGYAIICVYVVAAARCVTRVELVDGDGSGAPANGFRPDTRAWFDVRVGAATLRANVPLEVAEVRAHVAGAVPEDLEPVDLLISCRSWGHHYPIQTYAREAPRWVRPGGMVVTDIRRGTDGLEQMRRLGFRAEERIPDPSVKCERWAFRR